MSRPFLVSPTGADEDFDAAIGILQSMPLPDAEARENALDILQSWIVEAPAGSGKTGLLIQRYLKLLADESVTMPEQVLAITFTQKATAEIRERVIESLEEASRPHTIHTIIYESDFAGTTRRLAAAVIEQDSRLGWGLLQNPHRLNVRTIDSVSAEISRALPVLSGSGGAASPSTDASMLHREAARRTLMQLGGEDMELNRALQTVLLHRDGNLEDCEKLLAEMLALREQWGDLVPLSGEALTEASLEQHLRPQLERSLEQIICATLSQLEERFPAALLQQLTELAADLGEREGYNGGESPVAGCAGTRIAPIAEAGYLAHWRALLHLLISPSQEDWRKGFNKNHVMFEITSSDKEALKQIVEELRHRDDLRELLCRVSTLPPAKYPDEQWAVMKALFRVLRHALVELQLVFAERGECDFAELGLLATRALEGENGAGNLASALGMKLQHLLVDEMQDTSTSQYRLLQSLTQQWDGHSQTIFLVGDPKQSIYLFRQARLERFLHAMNTERLGDIPLTSLRLTANFRSRPGLVESFNRDFSRLFRGGATGSLDEIPYSEAVAIRPPLKAASDQPPVFWHTKLLPGDTSATQRRRQSRRDAEEVRAIVERWRARPLPTGRSEPWKIAVLVRNRSHLMDIVAAFNRDDGGGPIPSRAIDIEPLGQRQEVLDLVALTRALLHPADRVAWLALLRAPWCGLGLADLHLLAGKDDPALANRCVLDLIAERGHLLSDESGERLQRLWQVMRAAVAQGSGSTIAQLVERAWHSLGGDAPLTTHQRLNANSYLRLLDQLQNKQEAITATALKRRLNDLYAQPSLDPGAVDLLTIHKAKGLEWDVVIVPALHRTGRTNTGRLLAWDEVSSDDEQGANLVFAPITGKGKDSEALNCWVNNLHRTREAEERKRLFYVACTRAKEELHLFASPDLKQNGEVNQAQNSLLKAAWPAIAEHFVAADKSAEIIPVPLHDTEFGGGLALAASANTSPSQHVIQRLPASYDPTLAFAGKPTLPYGEIPIASTESSAQRPEASFAVRAFGNAVHAFLDLAATRLAQGMPPQQLIAELQSWLPRIHAVLRGDGLAPTVAERSAQQVRAAIENTLRDRIGLWLLSRHTEAANEFALTTWHDRRQSVRLDRTFRAGAEPLAEGQDCLWIVDYKTASHSPKGMEDFLRDQKAIYAPQLQNYARIMRRESAATDLRLALYYPMLTRLVWWIPDLDART